MTPPRLSGIGSHHSVRPITEEWLTPPEILAELGPFDLDPCAATERPWPTASRHLTAEDDGLSHDWAGRVWLNPPYTEVAEWLGRLVAHGDGVALVFARTETRWFSNHVWRRAHGILFIRGRLTFYRPDGTRSKEGHNSGGPSCLIAYGLANAERLAATTIRGAYVRDWARR